MADWLNKDDAKAVAVLATATVRQLGRDAPVVVRLQRLLRERSKTAFEDACTSSIRSMPAPAPRSRHRRPP